MNYLRGNKGDKSLIPEFVEYIPTDLKPGVPLHFNEICYSRAFMCLWMW